MYNTSICLSIHRSPPFECAEQEIHVPKPSQASGAACPAVPGAVAGAEHGAWAAVGHLSIFRRSKGSLLQAPE